MISGICFCQKKVLRLTTTTTKLGWIRIACFEKYGYFCCHTYLLAENKFYRQYKLWLQFFFRSIKKCFRMNLIANVEVILKLSNLN